MTKRTRKKPENGAVSNEFQTESTMKPRILSLLFLLAANAFALDPAAEFELGRKSLHGDGVKKDVRKAFELMKSAADQGHADAMGGVGYFYSNGIAVKKDDKEALVWFRKGAEKGSPKAMLNLGKMLLAGRGVDGGSNDATTKEGLSWLAKAADTGLPDAQAAYGSLFFLGEHGLPKDDAKALVYLKPAAESGQPDAMNLLGVMAENGQGMPQDDAVAKDWFRKAAEAGNAKAQSNLGRLLGPLNEDHPTRIEAIAWLIVSSGNGEITASKLIEESLPGFKQGDFEEAKLKAVELRKSLARK